jgi:large subunit ribosomal protein L5
MIPRLKKFHKEQAVPALMKRFGYTNINQVPTIKRIILNVGTGDPATNPGLSEDAAKTLTLITGQKAVLTKAKKAISNFKVKEGQAVGCKVSLSGIQMWEFLDRLVSLAIPRIRDFRGLSRRSMDGRGNYTLGLKEHIIFHEIDHDKIKKMHGMDISIVTNAGNDAKGLGLFEELGMPFRKVKEDDKNIEKKVKKEHKADAAPEQEKGGN